MARIPQRAFRHPAQLVVTGFAATIAVGTALLMLPVSRSGEGGAGFVTALFTSTSAVCVTGLSTVDVPAYWTPFGHAVILLLIQVGGFGIMTMASLLALLVSRRMGLRTRLNAAAETKALGLGDVRSVLRGVAATSLTVEAVTAVVLTTRLWLGYDYGFGRAVWFGVFHAVSAFNNAGFALWSDSLVGFATDWWVCLPLCVAVVLGGLGFPVILEVLKRRRHAREWSLHTRIVLSATPVLLVAGFVLVLANEWRNPETLGALAAHDRVLPSLTASVMARTAGFNSLDVGQLGEGTLVGTIFLMFIGGGSAGTAGGIKVTTFVLLFFVIWAEVRGEADVQAFGRRIGDRAMRQAVTVALLSVALVAVGTMTLVEMTPFSLHQVLFETTSAFATVGLSTGITGQLGAAGEMVLVILMFVGRLGPITLVSALALRERQRLYQNPEGRPIIG
ncbi:TrkH family potassium uptake protein [Nocardioides bruguierae]|uniref:TrkH family potassium uptake protein n=1 Tax=Nocardioides bruguierae TaxID=2945102 RepID=UPI002021B8D8|nr:potassium transporter TrkG [Nocardioides bruguierae]MCL8025634.1 TrkH family potassium uptake protein [Nocardioides bruguierae]